MTTLVVGIGALINFFILIWILSALGEIRKEARQTRQILAFVNSVELVNKLENAEVVLASEAASKDDQRYAKRQIRILEQLISL